METAETTTTSEPARKSVAANAPKWRMHSLQYRAFASKARYIVLPAGRRGGKSTLAEMWSLKGAHEDRLARIAGLTWFVSPTHAHNRDRWREFLAIAPPGWITGQRGTSGDPDFFELGPARIEFKSGEHSERLVGVGLRRVVIDECGIIRDGVWHESILPALIDHKAPALLIGTPKGRNWFFEMAMRGNDPLDEEVETIGFPTMANPFIDALEVKRTRKQMPERLAKQEIDAEFLTDDGAVFRKHRECIGELSKNPTQVIGVDLAKHQDFTVIIGMDADGGVTFMDRFREISWPLQKERITLHATKSGAHVILDSTGVGDPILDDLLKAGVDVEGYKFTTATKQQLIEMLSIGIEQRQVTLPNDPVLLNELDTFEYETSRLGHISYSAPDGLHDDTVIALALAYHGVAVGTYDLRILNA